MTTSSSGHYGSKQNNTKQWSPRRWFAAFGTALVVWTVLYLFSHSYMGVTGYESSRFSAADIRHINSILINGNTDNNLPETINTNTGEKQRINNTNDGFLDIAPNDSTSPVTSTKEYPQLNNIRLISDAEIKKGRIRLAMTYIASQYGEEISNAELVNIERYISTFNPRETGIFLTDYRLKLTSFFWFSGILAYLEVIFWVVFGVLCSLMFYSGNALRKGNGFNQRDIIYQSARLFYAPFAAVLFLLGYSYLKNHATLHTESGEGILIFAFLLGLTSGIVLDMLERFRLNKPTYTNTNSEGNTYNPTPYAAERRSDDEYAQQVKNQSQETATQRVENIYDKADHHNDDYLAQQEQKAPRSQNIRGGVSDDNEIPEVAIDLKLDFSGLFDDERTQLQRVGFSKAIVTLHNVNGKDIIPAKKQKNDMTIFTAADVKPGIYIARATLSQRLRDDQIMNLFGEKTAYITEDKPGLELYVKKYEAAD